jgi:hypothetical protein
LLQKLGGGGGPTTGGAAAEFGQALDCLLTGWHFLGAEQYCLENVPMLGLSGAPMLGGPNAKAAHHIFVEVSDSERGHRSCASYAVNRSNDSI